MRASVNAAAAVDDAIVHDDITGVVSGIVAYTSFADAHTARSQVMDMAMHDPAIGAAAAKPDGVNADVGNLAIIESDVAHAVSHDGGGNGYFGLFIRVALQWENVLLMLES